MFESDRVGSRVASAVEQLAAGWEELAALDPVALPSAELLDLLDRLETTARRHVGVACRVIAELAARGTAGEAGYPSVAAVLSQRLRIGRREAAGRVRLAADVSPRRALSGEQLPPRFPQVAAALVDGRDFGTPRSSAPPSTGCPTRSSPTSPNWSPRSSRPCSTTPAPRTRNS
jgi:hypothetical protein